MLIYNSKKIFLEKASEKKILCLTAGVRTHRFFKEYATHIKCGIAVFDNSIEKIGTDFIEGKIIESIQPFEYIQKYQPDISLLVITTERVKEIYDQIINMHLEKYEIMIYPFIKDRCEMLWDQTSQCYSDYYYYNHFDLTKRDKFVEEETNKAKNEKGFTLPYLPVYLTTKCTLNCEKCNNLIPYFKENATDFSEEKTIRALSKITQSVREIVFCELVGGEPFLYHDLNKVLDFVGTISKIRQIIIVTNGTVMPSEEIIQRLKQYNVLVRISDYGMFEKLTKLVARMEKEHINTRVLADMKWQDAGGIEPRHKNINELYEQYNRCIFSLRCKYLLEDKLFTCARIASLYQLGITNAQEDILDIEQSDNLAKDLKDFYLHDFGRGCDYCDLCTINGGQEIPSAIQKFRTYRKSDYTIIRVDELEKLKNRGK